MFKDNLAMSLMGKQMGFNKGQRYMKNKSLLDSKGYQLKMKPNDQFPVSISTMIDCMDNCWSCTQLQKICMEQELLENAPFFQIGLKHVMLNCWVFILSGSRDKI